MSGAKRAEKALREARDCLGRGVPGRAARHCRAALEASPGHPEARFLLGMVALRRGAPGDAVPELEAAVLGAPDNLDYQAGLGDALAASGAHARAAEVYERVLNRAPGAVPVRARLAVALQQAGHPARAVEHYDRALRETPQDPFLHYSLGTARKLLHDFDGAIEAYRQASDLAPGEARFAFALAVTLMERRRPAEAAAAFEHVLRLAPGLTEAWSHLCFTRMRCGDGEGAVVAARRFEALTGAGPETDLWLGNALLAAGRPDEALAATGRLLARRPAQAAALADRALALAALGRREEARTVADLDRLLHVGQLVAPPGFEDIESFNDALIHHLRTHPTVRFGSSSISCHHGDTSGEVLVAPKGPAGVLEEMLQAACAAYRSRLQGSRHPWVEAAPETLELSAWCTVLRRQGYQHGHIHPSSWLSGVYYLRLPGRGPRGAGDPQGSIELGRGPDHYPAGDQGEIRIVEPRPGTLLLFPSFVYHRTLPFADGNERVTIAFDFRPPGNYGN